MPPIGKLEVSGKSGKSYTFNIYILNTDFKDRGGLYLFTKYVNSEHDPIYLGQTQDLSSRFTNHHKEKCITKHGATHVSICRIENEKERIDAETDILGYYDFPCNERNN